MKKHILPALLLACLLPCAALAQVNPLPVDLSGGAKANEANYLSETVYEDESLRIEIEERDYGKTHAYIARVKIAHPSQLRTAPAYTFERDQTAPAVAIAERVNAVLAINGDYFSYQQFVSGGSYLVRQGQLYHDNPLKRDVLIIDENGDFTVEKEINDEVLAKYSENRIINSFNFGPGVVIDGEPVSGCDTWYNGAQKKTKRCGIGQVKRGELEYICLVTEGKDYRSGGGLTIDEFAEIFAELGVETAYNMDGGTSSAMIFGGEKLNATGENRPLSDIIYFATAATED